MKTFQFGLRASLFLIIKLWVSSLTILSTGATVQMSTQRSEFALMCSFVKNKTEEKISIFVPEIITGKTEYKTVDRCY